MMQHPISELLEKVDDRYTLVVAVARRARELTAGELPLTKCNSTKDVSIATQEIHSGKVTYHKKVKKG